MLKIHMSAQTRGKTTENFLKEIRTVHSSAQLYKIYKNLNKKFMKNYQWILIMNNLTFSYINLSAIFCYFFTDLYLYHHISDYITI